MARRPSNVAWVGFTPEQARLLDDLDFYGNNAWSRNAQTDEVMPRLLAKMAEAGLTIDRVTEAMRSIGYHKDALHQIDRWESKRLTGRFGR